MVKNNSSTITTEINTQFLNSDKLKEKLQCSNDSIKKFLKCKKNQLYLSETKDEYSLIAIDKFNDFKREPKNKDNDMLIYSIEQFGNEYNIRTGLYCGSISSGDVELIITSGYSDTFFTRMVNFCCGIYVDNKTDKNSKNSKSIYSLIIQYLFLVSLRRVANKSFPQKYFKISERGYNIKGNIDINEYVTNDLLKFDNKVTYYYSERKEIQNIIDVLYFALTFCDFSSSNDILPNMKKYKNYLHGLSSCKKPSSNVVNNITKEKCLHNSMFSDYKKTLEYAKILIHNNDVCIGGSSNLGGISGFLIDSSFVWEMYLYNLLKLNLPDWNIKSQVHISLYSDNDLLRKNNYPDLVLTNINTGKVAVFDAKFKTMNFVTTDIDNSDMQQLHSYAYYFNTLEGENFIGAALIYPTKNIDNGKKDYASNMFGLENAKAKFTVLSIREPVNNETMNDVEYDFICSVKEFLNV